MLAKKAPNVAYLFPHILNNFPTQIDYPTASKKVLRVKTAKRMCAFMRVVTSMVLMTITAFSYLAAIADAGHPLPFLLCMGFIGIPALILILVETMPVAMDLYFIDRRYGTGVVT